VTLPEPRFSPYKPVRVMHPLTASNPGTPGALLAADKAYRRRSLGPSTGMAARSYHEGIIKQDEDSSVGVAPPLPGLTGGLVRENTYPTTQGRPYSFSLFSSSEQVIETIPFRFSIPKYTALDAPGAGSEDAIITTRQVAYATPPPVGASDGNANSSNQGSVVGYHKLSKADAGYGGSAFDNASGRPGSAEGLLSQRLRSISAQNSESVGSGTEEVPVVGLGSENGMEDKDMA
jgi:hypothetical protein